MQNKKKILNKKNYQKKINSLIAIIKSCQNKSNTQTLIIKIKLSWNKNAKKQQAINCQN